MKASKFQVNPGEYAAVVTYTNHNDTTGLDEETTLRTHERPRPRFYTDLATLALRAREYFELGELRLMITEISFTDNDNGRFVRIKLETEGESSIRIMPRAVNRKPFVKPGEDAPDPDSKKNIFLAVVDLVENRITEYLNGDREQPELPMPKEEPAPKQRGLFSFGKKAAQA